jgi:manganese/zinc/iron transport system permease protein
LAARAVTSQLQRLAADAYDEDFQSMIDSLSQLARENYNTLVVLIGVSLLGASSGMIGAFAVLRRRALTGDALSHAALPGLCLAFLVLGEKNLPAMLMGALASGVIGIAIISALGRWTRVKDDAAIGTVLSVFFGLGIVLVTYIQRLPDVGSKAGLTSYIFGKTAGMVRGDVYVILAAALVCLGVVIFLYKEFQLVSFDGGFAQSLGWPVFGVDLLLMSLVAGAVVIGLPNVGVVLISALLIMPGAAARFWTDRLGSLLVLSGIFGLATGMIGTILSATFEQLPAGPIIVLTGTALFVVSMLLGTRRGAVARFIAHERFQNAWHERKRLVAAYDAIEAGRQPRSSLAPGEFDEALAAARGRRLWEAFLAEYPEQSSSADLSAASPEEILPAAMLHELQSKLEAAGRWPDAMDNGAAEAAR